MREDILMDTKQLMDEAESFIRMCYDELGKSERETAARLREINNQIRNKGKYEHTFEELSHGAKLAWRNSNRCIGRLFWDSLIVRDARHACTEEAVAKELLQHIEFATNGGKILPVITIFSPAENGRQRETRIWNHQLIRYAGYETADGIVGDPISLKLTSFCRELGWNGAGTSFDILPLVVQVGDHQPQWFDIPRNIVMEVPIVHPEYAAIAELGLQWYAVPFVSNMRLEIGGLNYTAAPFNGWYMGTEIGARNLADEFRYNMLPKVASAIGLDMSRESTLWRDRALVELNVAVLHSFKASGATIVDHHTASKQFGRFEERERQNSRSITGDWTWLIPPVSPAATAIFHNHYDSTELKPNFFYQG